MILHGRWMALKRTSIWYGLSKRRRTYCSRIWYRNNKKHLWSYKVIDGDKYDARYKDGNVVGLRSLKRRADNFER